MDGAARAVALATLSGGAERANVTALNWLNLVWVGAGGAVGSMLRFGVTEVSRTIVGDTFPLGTFIVNVVGSALLGFMAAAFGGSIELKEHYRLALMTGLMGGFTTYSTFAHESVGLATRGDWHLMALNIIGKTAVALFAAFAGFRLGEQLYPPPST